MFLLYQDLIGDESSPVTANDIHTTHTIQQFERSFNPALGDISSSTKARLKMQWLQSDTGVRREIALCTQTFDFRTFATRVTVHWTSQFLDAHNILQIVAHTGPECMIDSLTEYRMVTSFENHRRPRIPAGVGSRSLSQILYTAYQEDSMLKVIWREQTFTLRSLIWSRNWQILKHVCLANVCPWGCLALYSLVLVLACFHLDL